ncbi:MAG: restriction endonuclease subunit R [Lyngbya sp. HA4199-MV5]|jgi:hypothetical protein|nr:restriction endonuclease subunit R [Lyngbya sp. HA4199-MV5]
MVTLNARNLSRGDVHRLLKFQPLYNGAFTPLLTLQPLAETVRQELRQIQHEFRTYWAEGKISEGQIRFLAVAPLLRLAGFNRPPIRLVIEEEIARLYIEDEDTFITGRLDILAVSQEQQTANRTNLWILVVESKNSDASESAGIAQLLTYAFSSLEQQETVWGLVTNGSTYQFFYISRGEPNTYQIMPLLSFLEDDRATQLLQVLTAIVQWEV